MKMEFCSDVTPPGTSLVDDPWNDREKDSDKKACCKVAPQDIGFGNCSVWDICADAKTDA